MRWRMLDIPDDQRSPKFKWVVRLNSLGSLFFFEKYTLKRDKLSLHLHKPILDKFEAFIPRLLFEMPRDHLKTTMMTEGRNMWRVLPFTEADEVAMRGLGYPDEWIRWMHQIHNPGRRIAIVSETIDNAVKLGIRFDWHFQENERFRHVFSDIIPDSKCTWGAESKQIKAYEKGPNGEGTFDFLGVGKALQSRHYHDATEDDVVGRDALKSDLVMEDTHNYHRLLLGAFVSVREAEWTVVNNRWAPNDLSGWVRENNKKVPISKRFIIEHHGALGGCCDRHPQGQIIFPEEFTEEDYQEIRETQGPYYFSHQYLNLPVSPEECVFKPEWLRYYNLAPSPVEPGKQWIRHEVRDGEVLADINPKRLVRSMVIDINHSEERGRARHAVTITGLDLTTDRIYLLDLWAGSTDYDELVFNIFKLARQWGLRECWIENIAGQRLLRYPIEYRAKLDKWPLHCRFDLKTERSANAKVDRIESLTPVYRQGQFWCRRDQTDFIDEFCGYPGWPTRDILDCLGYATQTWNTIHAQRVLDKVRQHRERWNARKSRTGY
jgi:hypothetical protein